MAVFVLEPLPEGRGTPVPVTVAEPIVPEGVPDEPPALLDSCAKPTDAGLARKTLYTFFKNVSPTTQLGLPFPLDTEDPRSSTKIPPMHMLFSITPRFMSSGLMGHAEPPNAMDTLTVVEHGNA